MVDEPAPPDYGRHDGYGVVWQPTMELRWLARETFERTLSKTLQQRWTNNLGLDEWREVPMTEVIPWGKKP